LPTPPRWRFSTSCSSAWDGVPRTARQITKAALRPLLCPKPAMLAQLDRLLGLTGLSHVSLGIIPFGVELPTTPQNAFILFDDHLAVVETFVGKTMHRADEAAASTPSPWTAWLLKPGTTTGLVT